MRIIAGKFKGRKLETLPSQKTRPTSDKVRGAIFNALQSRVNFDGLSALDAFCGSGALGLEAISRGALSCLFIDRDPQALNIAKENARALLGEGMPVAKFKCQDALKAIENVESKFDLIFFDPPYTTNLLEGALTAIAEKDLLTAQGIIIAEMHKDKTMPEREGFSKGFEKTYGSTKIIFWAKNPKT